MKIALLVSQKMITFTEGWLKTLSRFWMLLQVINIVGKHENMRITDFLRTLEVPTKAEFWKDRHPLPLTLLL